MTVLIRPRHGFVNQVSDAKPPVALGELVYLPDLESLSVGDGKGGVKSLVKIIKGPDDGLYTKIDGHNGYIPLSIKAY